MKQEMYNNTPADGDDQVGRLLSGLPRVSAPLDFDLRLKGRIAQRSSAPATGFRLPAAVSYALGLGVVLVMFGLVGVAWMYSGNVGEVPDAVAEKVTPPASRPTQEVRLPDPEVKPPTNVEVASRSTNTGVTSRLAAIPKKSASLPSTPSTGGSTTESLKPARAVYPMGIPADPRVSTAPPGTLTAGLSAAKGTLSELGAACTVSGGRLRVDSVASGSSAANAGIMPGDVIISINDQLITQSTVFATGFVAASVKVLRGGKLVTIVLGK